MKVQLDNIELNYDWVDPEEIRSDEVLLFLHEALGSIGQWKDFPQNLCDSLGMKGLVYERQGHGLSSGLTDEREADYLHNYALEELPEFLNSLVANEQLILVGHSDGGSIALLYANKFPENVKAVITMAAHVINEPETIAGIAPAIEAWKDGKLEGLRKYHGENTDDIFWAWANIWRHQSFRNWDITKEIGSKASHLCLQGIDDQYGTEKQLLILKQNANAETRLIRDCGHHPHLEQQETVIRIISEWMASMPYIS
jgi:pimeloyl-ACP methyl ester carboxylesterase